MSSVVINLSNADPNGSRVVRWGLENSTEFYTTPKGELIVENTVEQWSTTFNPYAWQSYTVHGIDNTQEDADA